MSRSGPLRETLSRQWRYALVGGLLSVPLAVGSYWQSGTGNEFSLGVLFWGGLIAGALAVRGSVDAGAVGARAGAVGSVPALAWILPTLVDTAVSFAEAWLHVLFAPLFVVGFGVAVVALAALPGLVGGLAGGWLAGTVWGERTPAAGS